VAYDSEISPQVLNQAIFEKLNSQSLSIFIENVEKYIFQLAEEGFHKFSAERNELSLVGDAA
jgi:hypothetical protein